MKLCINEWKEFKISDLFNCSTTKPLDFDEIVDGNIIYITRSTLNNGCSGKVENVPDKLVKGGCITIGAEGKKAFYQKDDFLPGVKVYTLRNEHLNVNIGLFVCAVLNVNEYKYSYGRARILSFIKKETILLPADSDGYPDWQFMNDYMNELQDRERMVRLLKIL